MVEKQEARRDGDRGRAACRRRSYRIPQKEFERGAFAACVAWLVGWCLLWAVETGLVAWPWR